MRDSVARERTIGEILDVLVKDGALTDTDHPAHELAASTRRLLKRGDPPDKAVDTA
jgi:hypothetical protein